MIKSLSFLAAFALLSAPASAQDFSANSEAKSWNLYAEVPARFEAKVVDIMCELAGDCPSDCGSGTRQLGLIRTSDNVMVLAMKNSQAAFSGAAVDLAPYCQQTVELDGLLIDDPDLSVSNIYLVQRVKTADGEWAKANQFTKKWSVANPEAKGKGPWFRRDPRIKDAIASKGYLGLGLETDEAFITEYFE